MENKMLLNKRQEFNIFDAALASLLFLVFNFLFVIAYSLGYYALGKQDWVAYVGQFLIEAMFALVSLVIVKTRKVNLVKASGLNKKVSGRLVVLCLFVSLVAIYLLSHISSVFLDFLYLCGYKSQLGSIEINTFGDYLINVLVLCVTPAFAEELLFRGTIMSGLKKRGMWTSIIVSALIFSLMHGNPEQTVHQFLLGVIVGYLFYVTGNVWIGIIIHFFNNFISVTQAFIVTLVYGDSLYVEEATSNVNPWLNLAITLLIAVVLAYVGYLCLRYLKNKIFAENERINGKNVSEENNAVIAVDGEEQQTTLMVDGELVDEVESVNVETQTLKKEQEQLSVGTIVMFALSAVWLLYDWIEFLLMGFGI